MEHFERRRDRFEHFAAMQDPAINIAFTLELPDFRPWCKAQGQLPFHVLLFAVCQALMEVDNFRYRLVDGAVVKLERLLPSYTVLNRDNNLNFAQFEHCDDLGLFVARSLAAKANAENCERLLAPPASLGERELKSHVFITCMPWLDFTAIDHPMAKLAEADIPLIAWGKFRDGQGGNLTLPFALQAHHGFVDGYHFHLLAQAIARRLLPYAGGAMPA